MARIVMVVRTDIAHDARVLREASALVAAGHAVHVIGKDVPADWAPPDGVSVVSTSVSSAFRRGASTQPVDVEAQVETAGGAGPRAMPAPLRAARWLLLPAHRRSVQRSFVAGVRRLAPAPPVDIVHAHDFTALEAGAEIARGHGARLVYDAHEWWLGRARHGRPTPVERRLEARRERRLAQQADAVITVSEGIAERFRAWGCDTVAVVRNTFPIGSAPPDDLPAEPAGVVYAGRVGEARDLETLVAAAPAVAPLRVVLAGPPEPAFVSRLDLGSAQLRPATPVDAVDAVLRELGLAAVPLTDSCDNHRLALPNKLFHAVRAGVPVVAADLPEIRRVVQRYGIGTLYRPGDVASLVAAVRQARERYPQLQANVRNSRSALSWEEDARVLLDVYRGLADKPPPARHGR